MKTIQNTTRWLGPALACGIITLATRVSAQRPVILSFQSNGLLTWSNAYPEAIASVERLSDVVTTGAVVTVTETLGISDGSTVVYNYTVAHPPIVNLSVTISDATYSWNDQTGSSSPANFLGTVSSYASGQVTAIYLSAPSPSGTVIQVEYSYKPLITNQEWRNVYSSPATSQVMQVTVDMSKEVGFFRIGNGRAAPMVLIPGGSNSGTNPLGTWNGNPESYEACRYPATYSLSVVSFHMDQYEATKSYWDEVRNWNGGNGYAYDHAGAGKGPDHPVQTVSWYDCLKWCNARSQREGRKPVYYTDVALTHVYKTGAMEPYVDGAADGYRLPTSQEWEYAARGGLVSKRFPWGDTISYNQANYYATGEGNYDLSSGGYHPDYNDGIGPYTSPVGSFAPNAYGLYDMAGNVREWCWDTWCSSSDARVMRGGCWNLNTQHERVGAISYGYVYTISYANDYGGLRAVRSAGQ